MLKLDLMRLSMRVLVRSQLCEVVDVGACSSGGS